MELRRPEAPSAHRASDDALRCEESMPSSRAQSSHSSPSRPIDHSANAAAASNPLTSPQKSSLLKCTIMVQNVPAKAERQDLMTMFQCCGTVKTIYFHINQQGERSGSALIEFPDPACAAAALELSGIVCMGAPVQISPSGITILAMEQLDHEVRRQQIDPNNCLVAYISSLPPKINEMDLFDLFRQCGHIVSAKIIRPTLPSPAPPYAKVTFSSSSSCTAALKLDGAKVRGVSVTVDYIPPVPGTQSPPPSSGSVLLTGGGGDDDDDDNKASKGFQWLEGLPGTPLCPKSKEQKDCTIEFTQYFSEPADDVFRQGRFVSRAKVNGNNYTKDVHFMGFKWDGREVRIGDVVLLEAEEAEWVARIDKCWEERKSLSKPQNNRRLVSVMWYYHKKDLIDDLSASKKKLDQWSKHHLGKVWDDGNELFFSDHAEEELEIGCITGTSVTVVGTEEEYFKLSQMSTPNSRVFLQRFTYENRKKIVEAWQSMTPRTSDMVNAATARVVQIGQANIAPKESTLRKRGLEDIELEMHKSVGTSKSATKGGEKSYPAGQMRPFNVSDAECDDDRPLKKKRATPVLQPESSIDLAPLKDYEFRGWPAVKADLLACMTKLNDRDRQRLRQLDQEIGGILSTVERKMPTYKDLQVTQIHATLRTFYKDHPNSNNSNLARSIWSRWRNEYKGQHQDKSDDAPARPQPAAGPVKPTAAAAGPQHPAAFQSQTQTGMASLQHSSAPVIREKDDALRTGMKARLLRALSEQFTLAVPSVKAGIKPNHCDVVCEQIELKVHGEYRAAGEQYKRHIESLISCIHSKSEFALHLLQGCIDPSEIAPAVALKDGFLQAQRHGASVANRCRSAPSVLPELPLLGSVASVPLKKTDALQAGAGARPLSSAAPLKQPGPATLRSEDGARRSEIMTALAVQGDSQAGDAVYGSGAASGGWSLKDETFDYGV
jgi:RNA recognition motif-containing protein